MLVSGVQQGDRNVSILNAQQAQMIHGYLWYIYLPWSRFSQYIQQSNDKNMDWRSKNVFSLRKRKQDLWLQ